MRARIVLAALALLVPVGAASAQSPTEGPLAAPDAAVTSVPAKPKATPHKSHRKPAKAARRGTPEGRGDTTPGPTPGAQPVVSVPAVTNPADPVSFGMKWNGSSDDARETRIQNYNGNSPGTGAEVGMKLHF